MALLVPDFVPAPPSIAEALADIALSVNSSLELHDVLNDIVRRSRHVLGADRASILLLDGDGRLSPAASAARQDDPALWALFREMEPLGPDLLPFTSELFRAGRALVIDDVETSPLLPEDLKRTFSLKSLAIAPLVVQGEPCGALVVDHMSRPHTFTEDEVHTLEAVAASAATAVRNARAYADAVRRAGSLDQMLRVAAALNAAPSLHQVLQCAMDGMLAILGGESCSVNLVDNDRVTTLASRGLGQPEPGVHRLCGVDSEERERIRRAWVRDPNQPLVYDGARRESLLADCPELRAPGSLVLVPFAQDGRVRGFVAVGTVKPREIDSEQFTVAVSIAGQVWLAIERARLNEDVARRLHHLEILYRLSDEVALAPDMQLVLQRLAPSVRAATGAELIDVFLCDARASRLFVTPPPQGPLATLMRNWRRRQSVRPTEQGGLVVVPMRVDEQLVGVMRVRPVGVADLGRDEEDLLMAIAAGVGGVVGRAVLRAEIAEGERELLIADERERIARDLHDTLGQMLFAIGLEIGECAHVATDPVLERRLTAMQRSISEANAEVRQAIHALSFLERGGHDLVRSLRNLVRKHDKCGLFRAELKVSGAPVQLAPGKEEALFRVAHEALTNVEKHARATTVVLRLEFTADAVRLTIRDDGIGMASRPGGEHGMHFGLRTMRRRMSEVGGSLEIDDVRPHGVRLTAVVPPT